MGVYKEIEISYFEALERAEDDELMIRRFITLFTIKPERFLTAQFWPSNNHSLSK